MAVTPLLAQLRRSVERTSLRTGCAGYSPRAALGKLGRRAFLSAASLALGCSVKSDDPAEPVVAPEHRIAIIGGGLAGLTCAYWLGRAGVPATVYEASTRVGGRIYTLRGELPEPLFGELGGEFIAPEHATMRWLARALDVPLEAYAVTPSQRVFWVGSRRVPEQDLLGDLASVWDSVTAELESADERGEALSNLDATPLARWLEHTLNGERDDLLALLKASFRAEFGLEPERQSALNLLSLVGPSETGARFGDSLAYTAVEGADSFAKRLEEQLRVPIRRKSRLIAVEREKPGSYRLSFETPTGLGFQVDAERIVFALPFSVLRHVDLTEAGLSEEKLALIASLTYGSHSKLVAAFGTAGWAGAREILSDRPFQLIWDGALNQSTNGLGLLSNLVGGKSVSSEASADDAMLESITELDLALGTTLGYLPGSARRIRWANEPNFEGSIASPSWGHWLERLTAGAPEGTLHFCGEHTSIDFQGTMEGAAESGTLVASQILTDLTLTPPEGLEALVSLKSRQGAACLRDQPLTPMRPLARRRSVLEDHAAFVEELP